MDRGTGLQTTAEFTENILPVQTREREESRPKEKPTVGQTRQRYHSRRRKKRRRSEKRRRKKQEKEEGEQEEGWEEEKEEE